MIYYKCADCEGDVLLVLDSKEFDEMLEDFRFKLIRKNVDWENKKAELVIGLVDEYVNYKEQRG